MYERFTDRARKVMHLANQEAQRLNHEYIGTEHVILGLVKEGSGVAAWALKNLGVDLVRVRDEVSMLVTPATDPGVTMGKLPHTPRVVAAIQQAIKEAVALRHNYVGTEHLLLGLIHDEKSVAGAVLKNLGVQAQAVRAETLSLLGQPPEGTPPVRADGLAVLHSVESGGFVLLRTKAGVTEEVGIFKNSDDAIFAIRAFANRTAIESDLRLLDTMREAALSRNEWRSKMVRFEEIAPTPTVADGLTEHTQSKIDACLQAFAVKITENIGKQIIGAAVAAETSTADEARLAELSKLSPSEWRAAMGLPHIDEAGATGDAPKIPVFVGRIHPLQPFDEEWDGTIKPISELSYIPADSGEATKALNRAVWFLDCYDHTVALGDQVPVQGYGPATLKEVMDLSKRLGNRYHELKVTRKPRGLVQLPRGQWPSEAKG